MKTTFRAVLVLLILPMLASPAFAQANLEGTWELQASGVLPPQEIPALNAQGDRGVMIEPCVFEGSGNMTQTGDQLSGQATLMLVSGPDNCPSEMMADLTGTVEGTSFFGTLDGGQMFGLLDFQGTIADDGRSMQGSYTVEEGPFTGTTNTSWTAALRLSILDIPTLGTWGVTLLATLLALTSLLFLRRTWA